jgi:shikimate dehydrogenase
VASSPILPGIPLPLTGASRLFAILGDPIAQAGSPTLFNTAFRQRNAGAVLVPMHVEPNDLATSIAAFRATRNFDGLVITVPHKIAAAALVDVVEPMGRRVGAINAIRKQADGKLVGDNFDGQGFIDALSRDRHSLAGKRVLLVGAGGAGLAVAHAIVDRKPASLGIFDIVAERTSQLVASLRAFAGTTHIGAAAPSAEGYDVIVNCTPLGMKEADPLPLTIDRIDPTALVVDIILQPPVSRLLREAAGRGCDILPGRHMLEGQVAEVCRFFGLPEDGDVSSL